jgi:hypothetical protein
MFFVLAFIPAFAERNVSLDVFSTVTGSEQLSNETLGQGHAWNYTAEFDAHIVAAPAMTFEDNFQPDALLDVYFSKLSSTNLINISLKEAFVDFLFYDALSLKSGFIRLDYGYNNSSFHPLNVIQMLPELAGIYKKIMIGNSDQGYIGIPSEQLKFTVPEFIPDLKLSLEQSMIWNNITNLAMNYYLSKLGVIYKDLDISMLMGYNGNSWDVNNANRYTPVLGGSLSYRFPYDIMFYGETVYRYESYRPYISNTTFISKRSGSFYDVTAVLSYTLSKDPFFNNPLSTSLEYFYNGQGMTADQYSEAYSFLTNNPSNLAFGPLLLIPERNFYNYLLFNIGYTITDYKLGFNYSLEAEVESRYLKQTVSIGKSYNNVTLSAAVVFNQSGEEKYHLIYGDMDAFVYLQMMMSL